MEIAVISGASSGLGRAYARAIAERYPELDEIWLVARRAELLRRAAEESDPARARPTPLDLSTREAFATLSGSLKEKEASVRILVDNAGAAASGPFAEMSAESMANMVDLDARGATLLIRACLPHMRAGSRIIVAGSTASFAPMPGLAVYSAAKAYVRFLAQALREELRPSGISVLLVCPGNVDTEMNPRSRANSPLGRLPFLDAEKIVRRSLDLAAKGRAVYTPGAVYKWYRVLAKLWPASWLARLYQRMLLGK